MTQKLLHGADVVTRLQQMGRERVPQGVGVDGFRDARRTSRGSNSR
jgi:hypothetical protein